MRALIRRLSRENVLWSAETIHGHQVLLGFDPPCPDTKYMVKQTGGTDKSQTWLTFLRNHMQISWAMGFFTVPTIRFQILHVFVVLEHSRRQAMHFGVTAHLTMAWVIQQLREPTPFGLQPRYMFRDNDGIYGDEVSRFLVGTGIEEVKTAYRSPWQNPFVERYGGTLRRELLDHVIILNVEQLKGLLKEFKGLDGTFSRSQIGTRDWSESLGFDSGCRWTASPLRSGGGLISSLRDNHRKQKQNGPGLLKVGSPARHLELQNSSFARARVPAVVLNGCPTINFGWGFSGRQGGIGELVPCDPLRLKWRVSPQAVTALLKGLQAVLEMKAAQLSLPANCSSGATRL